MHTIANKWIIAAGTLWNDPLLRTQLAPLIRNNNKIIKNQRRDEDTLKKDILKKYTYVAISVLYISKVVIEVLLLPNIANICGLKIFMVL